MADDQRQSLDDYAAGRGGHARSAFWHQLPDELRTEILESSAPTVVVVDWLIELGWTEATFGKVDPYRRRDRRRAADVD